MQCHVDGYLLLPTKVCYLFIFSCRTFDEIFLLFGILNFFKGESLGEHEIKVSIALSQRNIRQLESEFWAVSDPQNINYGTRRDRAEGYWRKILQTNLTNREIQVIP
jgi:hypothetical protein